MLVVVAPVAFLRMTSDPFNIPKLSLLAIGVPLVLAVRVVEILHGRSSRGLQLLLVPAALLALPLAFSWALSPYRGWAVLGMQARFEGLLPYVLVILLGMLVADTFRGRSDELAFALLWAGAIVGGYAILQTIGLDPFDWTLLGAPTEAVSTTGNPNFTGGFLGIVLPVGLGLVLTDPGRRRVAIRLLILLVGGWIVARSQGGWAAGVAGSAIVGGYYLRDRYRLAHIVGWVLAAAVATVTVGVVLVAMVRPESRFVTTAALLRGRWSEAAVGMAMAHPFAGRGPNSFAIEGVRYRSQIDAVEFSFDFPDDPHSVPMSMLANLGLPGFIGFLGILAWALWFFFRNERASFLQVAFTGGVVAYFIQSLVSIDELTLRVGLWTVLAGMVAASFVTEATNPKSAKARAKGKSRPRELPVTKRSAIGTSVVSAALLGCIAWSIALLVADVFARQGTIRFATGDVAGGLAKYESALSLRDSADYRGRLAFGLKPFAVEEDGRIDEEVLAAADAAFSFTEQIPYVFSIVGHARLLEEVGRATGTHDAEAIALYERAMELDPRNPMIRAEVAQAWLRRGQPGLALEALVDIKNVVGERLPQYWGVLALAAAREGETALAREALAIAVGLDPAEPSAVQAQELLET